MPGLGPHKKQIRDIGTGDEQDAEGGPQEEPQTVLVRRAHQGHPGSPWREMHRLRMRGGGMVWQGRCGGNGRAGRQALRHRRRPCRSPGAA